MAKSRWAKDWVHIKFFGEEDFLKVKILSRFKDLGVNWIKLQRDDGYIFNIPVDSLVGIWENKKAKVIPYSVKLKVVK